MLRRENGGSSSFDEDDTDSDDDYDGNGKLSDSEQRLVRRLIKKARRRLPLPAAEAQPAQRKLGTDETAVLVKSSENAANVLGDAGGQVFGGQQEGEGFQQKDQNSVLVVEASSSTSSSLTAKAAGKEWSEMVQIRSLGDQLSGPTSSLRTGQCERGVEGYSFESDNWVKGNQQVAGKKRRHENGGGDANEHDGHDRRGDGWQPCQKRFRRKDTGRWQWRGGKSGHGTRGRGGSGGQRHPSTSTTAGDEDTVSMLSTDAQGGCSSSHQAEKNKKTQKDRLPAEQYVPRHMMRHGYDRGFLFNTELDDAKVLEFSDEELTQKIAAALGEKFPEMIEKVVEVAGRQAAVNLYRRAQAVERDGGMLVEKGNRRRTPGGVFLHLFKTELQLEEGKRRSFTDFAQRFQDQLKMKREEHKTKEAGPSASCQQLPEPDQWRKEAKKRNKKKRRNRERRDEQHRRQKGLREEKEKAADMIEEEEAKGEKEDDGVAAADEEEKKMEEMAVGDEKSGVESASC